MFYVVCTVLVFIVGIGCGIKLCISSLAYITDKRWENGIKCVYPVGDKVMIITEIQEIDTDGSAVLAIIERE